MIQYIQTIAKDSDTREMDSNVSRVFQSLYPNPLLNNPTIVKGIVFTTNTDVQIAHRLGRTPVGYIIVNKNSNGSIYTSSTTNVAPTAYMILKSDANVTADILFF